MKFIAIDSSLANTGIAFGTIDNDMEPFVDEIQLCSTEKSKNKQVRASSDTIERCRKTFDFVDELVNTYKPDFIFVETPSGSQSSSGMKSYGATCQLIASLTPRAIEVTPHEVKMASVGKKTASKREMIDWAYEKFPEAGWLFHGGKLQNKNEHMADAIAIVYAGIQTNEFQRVFSIVSK